MYATKRRRRNVKNYKHPPKESQKSNPSKRHRERLNAELENLASLLPFEQNVLTKLDKLSILRLAVSYLRIKSYFQANLKNSLLSPAQELERNKYSKINYLDPNFSEGNSILESLNGFILIVNTNSEVFYASRTVEQYIGFHQSDIIHQSVFELIHSEDREDFKKHLSWNSKLPPEKSNLTLNEILSNKEYSKYLERNFTVRFRCLLDNTSGFLTLDIVGRLNVLSGQRGSFQINANGEIINPSVKTYSKSKNSKQNQQLNINNNAVNDEMINPNSDQEPMLALFAIACPFGPPSLFELPQRDSLFKTKHKINMTPISLDSKGKLVLGYSDNEFISMSGYELVHPDDLKYYANSHKELLKTGSSGLICYRVLTSSKSWQWLQSSMRIIYKSNKPECIIANHRPLTNEEGEELYYKRGFEFKLPYPCLYDFETNFGSSNMSSYSNSSENSTNNATNANTSINNSSISLPISSSKPNIDIKNPATKTLTNSTKSNPNSTAKTKQNKYNKGQMTQQRAAKQQKSQDNALLNQIYQNQYVNGNISQSYLNNNSNNNTHSENNNQLDYYGNHLCKTEVIEDATMYDNNNNNSSNLSKNNNNNLLMTSSSTPSSSSSNSDYSSASSISSVASSTSIPTDTISININNPASSSSSSSTTSSSSSYNYTNYFQAYGNGYNNCFNDTNKFYAAAAANSPYFYSNNQISTYNNSNSSYYSLNDTSNNQNNLHSNNSNSSTSSSLSSSSSSNSINSNTYNVLWHDTLDSHNLKLQFGQQQSHYLTQNNYPNHHSLANYNNGYQDQYASSNVGISPANLVGGSIASASVIASSVNGSSTPSSTANPSYNELLSCANNAAAMAAAAKYSCAAAAASSTYNPYPFTVDDYSSSVSQIQL